MIFKKMPKLSDRLQYLRKLHGLSQAELAEKANTTQQAIQQAEKGKARQPRYLNHLAQALDVPTNWLIFGEGEKQTMTKKKPSKGFNDKSNDVLENFFAMPKEDQKLMLELMKSRKISSSKK